MPVVAITAFDDEGKKGEVLEAGADAYLTKPIDGAELLRQVQGIPGRGSAGEQY